MTIIWISSQVHKVDCAKIILLIEKIEIQNDHNDWFSHMVTVSGRAQNKNRGFQIPSCSFFNTYTYTFSNRASVQPFLHQVELQNEQCHYVQPSITYPHWPLMTTCPLRDWSLLLEEQLLHLVGYGIQTLGHWKWNPSQQKLCDFEGVAGPLGTSLEALRKEQWTSQKCHNVHQYFFFLLNIQTPNSHTPHSLSAFPLFKKKGEKTYIFWLYSFSITL